jgi:hypothetical protein
MKSHEQQRLEAHRLQQANWKNWGPYLSERAWGTVREDYSVDGDAWQHFPHEHARARAYRWNEDGIGGISDRNQYLCCALALWNGKDTILKERMFGVSGPEGNHGEDVKEYYFYLDNLPTHSYMKMLYKYPQNRFPYEQIIAESAKRGTDDFEYELLDTGTFDKDEYFDVFIEYAKAGENDILADITIFNRSSKPSECHILPTIWFRNTWSWGYADGPMGDVPDRPLLHLRDSRSIEAVHATLGRYFLFADTDAEIVFTENDTNTQLLYGRPNSTPFVKDAFHRFLIDNEHEAVNPQKKGTKAAFIHRLNLGPGESKSVRLRLTSEHIDRPFEQFEQIFLERKNEADEFYASIQRPDLGQEEKMIQRQAFAGLLWSKQLYYYDVEHWSKVMPPSHSPLKGSICAITAGSILSTLTLFPCQTSGNTLGMPLGTWLFTPSLWCSSIPISPKGN